MRPLDRLKDLEPGHFPSTKPGRQKPFHPWAISKLRTFEWDFNQTRAIPHALLDDSNSIHVTPKLARTQEANRDEGPKSCQTRPVGCKMIRVIFHEPNHAFETAPAVQPHADAAIHPEPACPLERARVRAAARLLRGG